MHTHTTQAHILIKHTHIHMHTYRLLVYNCLLQQSSMLVPDSSMMEHLHQEGNNYTIEVTITSCVFVATGPVGTALYTSPEVLYSTAPTATRYSDVCILLT